MVKVAALADLHVEETSVQPYRDLFAEISQRADVLVLCGDLTNLGKAHEAEILAQDLHSSTVPVIGVLGNHDHESGQPAEVVRILQDAGMRFLESQTHEFGGVGFAGVKGFAGGFGTRMLSSFGEDAIKRFVAEAADEAMRLENALRMLRAERKVAVLHYSPIAATLAGEPPELYAFLGCSRLAETIDRFEVDAVFHGHAHHGSYSGTTGKGIPVYNCARPVAKEGGRPYALIEL
jgi:Icc-related predicted phosphoesterase